MFFKDPFPLIRRAAEEERIPVIDIAVAAFLQDLIVRTDVGSVLEIGTAVGYSAMVMASAAGFKGQVVSVDCSAPALKRAEENIREAGLYERIELNFMTGIDFLRNDRRLFDLIFIDARKEEYPDYFALGRRRLGEGGSIVLDNLLWHGRVLDRNAEGDRRTEILRAFCADFLDSRGGEAGIYALGDGLGWFSLDKKDDKEVRESYIHMRVKNEFFISFQT